MQWNWAENKLGALFQGAPNNFESIFDSAPNSAPCDDHHRTGPALLFGWPHIALRAELAVPVSPATLDTVAGCQLYT